MTSQSEESESLEFWQRQAMDALALLLTGRPPDSPRPELTDEIDELLWTFAEGRLPERDADRLWALAVQIPEAKQRLDEIHSAIEKTARMPTGDPAEVWSKLTAPGQAVRSVTTTGIFDMVLRLAQEGLELLSTTGRPAYAPALVRSDETTPKTTVALEFLTSVGTFQVTVDQTGPGECNLTVIATRLTGRLDAGDLDLELRDSSETLRRSKPFDKGRARVLAISKGTYRLVLVQDEIELASLSLDLRE